MDKKKFTRRQFLQSGSVGAAALFLQSQQFPNLAMAVGAGQKPGPATRTAAPPCTTYPPIGGLDCRLFDIPRTGLSPAQRTQALDQLKKYLEQQKRTFLGYQTSQDFTYSDKLSFLLDMSSNDIADPFRNSNFTVNTKIMERAVLDYVARLWHARIPSNDTDPESYWGYVVSMGSTEGNLYGLFNARDYLAGKRLYHERDSRTLYQVQTVPSKDNPNAYRPVIFFSEDTHYSIIKIARALEIPTFYQIGTQEYPDKCPLGGDWPHEVPSVDGNAGPGCVDLDKLAVLVEFFASKGFPILVVLNYGTTFKGAYDNVEAVGNRLLPILKKYGLDERKVPYDPDDPSKKDTRNGYWIHVDGALGASYMPFIEMAYEQKRISERGPNFDFRLPFVHSIVTSGHKWPGCPMPCGIYMTLRKYQIAPPDDPEYIGAPDTTFAGSRNAFSPVVLWLHFASMGEESQIKAALMAEELAAYTHRHLQELDEKYGGKLWVAHTPLALTVRFRKPNDVLVFKYSLSSEIVCINGEARPYVHIYVMRNTTREKIDQLLADLAKPNAFDFKPLDKCGQAVSKKAKLPTTLQRGARRLTHVPHVGRSFR